MTPAEEVVLENQSLLLNWLKTKEGVNFMGLKNHFRVKIVCKIEFKKILQTKPRKRSEYKKIEMQWI